MTYKRYSSVQEHQKKEKMFVCKEGKIREKKTKEDKRKIENFMLKPTVRLRNTGVSSQRKLEIHFL
jgi:hypothetical protein